MMDEKDNELFAALKEGDRSALSSLFTTYYDYLLHYGLKISRDDNLVEECIQELFLYLIEAKDRLANPNNVKAYLFTALRRRILEKMKAAKHRASLLHFSSAPDILFSVEDILIRREGEEIAREQLHRALNELSVRQKEAVYLRYFNSLNTQEIAEIMGVSNQTVLNTLHQALKKLHHQDHLKRLISLSYPLIFWLGHCFFQ